MSGEINEMKEGGNRQVFSCPGLNHVDRQNYTELFNFSFLIWRLLWTDELDMTTSKGLPTGPGLDEMWRNGDDNTSAQISGYHSLSELHL